MASTLQGAGDPSQSMWEVSMSGYFLAFLSRSEGEGWAPLTLQAPARTANE